MNDADYIAEALTQARIAYANGEAPVGAVLVRDGEILTRAATEVYRRNDPTAHAEILVMRQAGALLGRWKFRDCVLYTSLYPCPMCENAMLQAEVPKVVYGGSGFKESVVGIRFSPSNLVRTGPVMEAECRGLFIQWLRETGHDDMLKAEGL